MNKKITAVIPAYNEENHIGRIVENVIKFVDEVIVVNDGSNDNTSNNAKNKGANVIDLNYNTGVGNATRIGCDYAIKNGADIILTIDADGQHNPEDISKLLDPLLNNEADIIFGVRLRNKKMPLCKRIGNFLIYLLAKLLFKSDIYDILTGFHAFKSECYNRLRWESTDYGVVSEFVYKTIKEKLRYKQVLVETIYNNNKKNGMKINDGIKSIFMMLKWSIKK